MPALVVDASVALAWGLPDEISPYADSALIVAEQEGLHVPDIWAREVANGLAVAYLRKRITTSEEQQFLVALSRLSIIVESLPPLSVLKDGTAAAIRFDLTAYDAAYVDLAMRQGLHLATLDDRMRKAAAQFGVPIFK